MKAGPGPASGRLRLSRRPQESSVHQFLVAESTSAWIPGSLDPGNLGPSEVGQSLVHAPAPHWCGVSRPQLTPLGWVWGPKWAVALLPHLLGARPASHSPLSPPSDNVDDPTGNFRSGPLTGWRVFLLLLCALLGIIVCAVVGAVVFQKRQERNKRFY